MLQNLTKFYGPSCSVFGMVLHTHCGLVHKISSWFETSINLRIFYNFNFAYPNCRFVHEISSSFGWSIIFGSFYDF